MAAQGSALRVPATASAALSWGSWYGKTGGAVGYWRAFEGESCFSWTGSLVF